MPSPITSADFEVTNFSADVCEQLSQSLSINSRLKEFFAWAIDANGEATQNFKNLFLSIGVPIGAIIHMPVASVPAGFLLANGAAVSRVTYAPLFAVYGTQFGTGDGTTTFNLPNRQNMFLMGAGGSHVTGDTGGEERVTLTVNELPAHHHSISARVNEDTDAGTRTVAGSGPLFTSSYDTGDTGGSQSHNNLPPFAVGLWICKY